jgi:hypothetical protein
LIFGLDPDLVPLGGKTNALGISVVADVALEIVVREDA